jgi:hypothetical protein
MSSIHRRQPSEQAQVCIEINQAGDRLDMKVR